MKKIELNKIKIIAYKEISEGYININKKNNIEIDIKEPNNEKNTFFLKKDINDIIPPKLTINIKQSKDNINNNTRNSNKYLEEKSSERNVLESFTLASQKNLNLKNINENLNNVKTINVENNEYEKNKNNNINEIELEKINMNAIIEQKFLYKKRNTLIIKNKKRNKTNPNINKTSTNNIFSNNSFNNGMKDNNNNIEMLYKCLFCGAYSTNSHYNLLFTCQHFFCIKCGKNIFEELIDTIIKTKNSDMKIKCPVISCKNLISLSLLKVILSENYYDIIKENIFKIKEKNRKGKSLPKVFINSLHKI